MIRKSLDLILAAILAASAVLAAAQAMHTMAFQIWAGAPLALLLPGYVLTAALFPRRTIGFPERLLFSIAASLAMDIIVGFALHWTVWGLQAIALAIGLGGIVLVIVPVAWVRRNAAGDDAAVPTIRIRWNWRPALLVASALLVLTAAVSIVTTSESGAAVPGFTQLWIHPESAATPEVIQLGIANQEAMTLTYTLLLNVDGTPTATWETIQLQAGQQWDTRYVLAHNTKIVKADLYRSDRPNEPYRSVMLRSQ